MPATCSTAWADHAARLAGVPVLDVAVGGRGGNNRLWRVSTADGRRLALKTYPRVAGDGRDRLGAEVAALTFLAQNDIGPAPRLLAADRAHDEELMSWVEGAAPGPATAALVDQMAAFAARLHAARRAPGAQALGWASEACVSAAALLEQVETRLARLRGVADAHPGLAALLDDAARLRDQAAPAARAAPPLDPAARTLSPADFGLHNALLGADGRLVFLDFEYFGWDDPVKLVAELPLHPAMDLGADLAARWRAALAPVYEEEPGFGRRLAAFAPLFAVRWALIVLNEFLPERWARRQAAGETDAQAARARQLAKARALLAKGATP